LHEAVVELVLGSQADQHVAVDIGGAHPLERGAQGGAVLVAGHAGEQRRGKPLQHLADLVDADGLLARHGGDDRALVRDDLDQPLRFELAQRLAHQRAADARHLAQVALGHPVAGTETADGDGLPDAFGDVVAKRRGGPVHPEVVTLEARLVHALTNPTHGSCSRKQARCTGELSLGSEASSGSCQQSRSSPTLRAARPVPPRRP
jgi:hypothetical protein